MQSGELDRDEMEAEERSRGGSLSPADVHQLCRPEPVRRKRSRTTFPSQAAPSLILPQQASRSFPAPEPEASCHLMHVNNLMFHHANERASASDLQPRPRFQQSGPKCQQIYHHGDRSGVELRGEETAALHTVARPKF